MPLTVEGFKHRCAEGGLVWDEIDLVVAMYEDLWNAYEHLRKAMEAEADRYATDAELLRMFEERLETLRAEIGTQDTARRTALAYLEKERAERGKIRHQLDAYDLRESTARALAALKTQASADADPIGLIYGGLATISSRAPEPEPVNAPSAAGKEIPHWLLEQDGKVWVEATRLLEEAKARLANAPPGTSAPGIPDALCRHLGGTAREK